MRDLFDGVNICVKYREPRCYRSFNLFQENISLTDNRYKEGIKQDDLMDI